MHNKRSPLTDTPTAPSVSGVLFAFLPTFTGKQRINEKKVRTFSSKSPCFGYLCANIQSLSVLL